MKTKLRIYYIGAGCPGPAHVCSLDNSLTPLIICDYVDFDAGVFFQFSQFKIIHISYITLRCDLFRSYTQSKGGEDRELHCRAQEAYSNMGGPTEERLPWQWQKVELPLQY